MIQNLNDRPTYELEHLQNGPLPPEDRREIEEVLRRRQQGSKESKDQLGLWDTEDKPKC